MVTLCLFLLKDGKKLEKAQYFFLLYNFLVDQFTTSLEANFCRLHIQPFNFLIVLTNEDLNSNKLPKTTSFLEFNFIGLELSPALCVQLETCAWRLCVVTARKFAKNWQNLPVKDSFII